LVPGIPLDFGYVPRCGVFFHLPSEARETFDPTELEVNDGFARKTSKNDPTKPNNQGFSITLWSLYMSPLHPFSTGNGNMVGKSPESANLRLNGSAQPLTTSSMKRLCLQTDHPTVTLILVNGV